MNFGQLFQYFLLEYFKSLLKHGWVRRPLSKQRIWGWGFRKSISPQLYWLTLAHGSTLRIFSSFFSGVRWFHTKAILWIPPLLSNQNKYFSKTTHWSSECTNHSRPCYSRQRWYRSKVRVLKTNSFLCFYGFAGWDSVVWKFSNLCHIWDFSPLLPVTGTKQTFKDFMNTSMIGILFRYHRRT